MATFMKLDVSDPIATIQKLEKAFNEDDDNLKCYALLFSLINEFKITAAALEDILEKANFNKVILTEADKIIAGPKKREKIFRKT